MPIAFLVPKPDPLINLCAQKIGQLIDTAQFNNEGIPQLNVPIELEQKIFKNVKITPENKFTILLWVYNRKHEHDELGQKSNNNSTSIKPWRMSLTQYVQFCNTFKSDNKQATNDKRSITQKRVLLRWVLDEYKIKLYIEEYIILNWRYASYLNSNHMITTHGKKTIQLFTKEYKKVINLFSTQKLFENDKDTFFYTYILKKLNENHSKNHSSIEDILWCKNKNEYILGYDYGMPESLC